MRVSIKKAVPGCFGASVAVTFVQFFRHFGVWGIGDFLYNFAFTFIITTIIVTVCIWSWERIKGKKCKKD